MSLPPLDAALQEFKPDDYTVRLVNAVFKVVPYSPVLQPYHVVEDAVKALTPAGQPPNGVAMAKARQQSMTCADLTDVLWMANLIDQGDRGYALFSGLSSVVGLLRGQGSDALETDSAQRNDAALKAIGLAYMAYNAFPGSMLERAEAFRTTPAGQALTLYYASVEIALPFADNAAMAGGSFFTNLISKDGAAQANRLSGLAGGKSLEGAMGMLTSMQTGIQRVVDHAQKYTKPIAESAQAHLPGAMNVADKAAGALASAADVLPVYRYLGARLAAEGAAWRGMKG